MNRAIFFLLFSAALLSGCDTGLKQMGPTEAGVVFRKLPPILGGGVSSNIIPAAQKAIVWPWDTIFRFDTSEHYISWGGKEAGKPTVSDGNGTGGYLYTRALDGNEVALAVTVVYQISPDPARLVHLAREVATTNEAVRDLIVAVGRADIRTYMNHLKTAEFADSAARYKAVGAVQKSMNERLNKYGIEITRVSLDDFQFERLLRDGTIDSIYQEKLTQIQKLTEDTNREIARILTVRAKKEKEFNDAQAKVNQITQESEGYRNQAKLRADAYFKTKKNEAEGILAKGKAEADGLTQQVAALSGSGGESILKIELARQLIRSNPQFVVMQQGGATGLEVRKLDANELLSQLGIVEGLSQKKVGDKTGEKVLPSERSTKE